MCIVFRHGHLPEQGLHAAIIKNPATAALCRDESDDSDFDVD